MSGEDWLADLEVCLEEKLLCCKPETTRISGLSVPCFRSGQRHLFQNVHPLKMEGDVPF